MLGDVKQGRSVVVVINLTCRYNDLCISQFVTHDRDGRSLINLAYWLYY